MKLGIIIPYHNEDKLVNTLKCLDLQQLVNFDDIEILIINNCESPRDISDLINITPNLQPHIKYFSVESGRGPGPSRQFGINTSSAEYLLFIDCGDLLYSVLSLYDIFQHIITQKDYYSYKFLNLNENGIYEDGGLPVSHSVVWDKVYNREFLIKNNICFDNDIFYEEDVHFAHLLSDFGGDYEAPNKPLYVHLLDVSSLGHSTMSNFDTFKRYIKDTILSKEIEIKFIKEHNLNINIEDTITYFCPYPYWYLQQYVLQHPEDREIADQYVCNLWRDFVLAYNPQFNFGSKVNKCIHYLDETYSQFIKRNFPEVTTI